VGDDLTVTGPLDPVQWPRQTERLTIRPMTRDDLDAVWRVRRKPACYEWLPAASVERDDLARLFDDPGRLERTLVIELDGAVVGDLMLRVEDAWAQREVLDDARNTQAELGWVVDPAYGGRGLATEAVRELLRICFEDLELRRVVAGCFADNTASWRLMERLGMRREEHTVAGALHRSGEWLDGYGYAMLATEWRDSDTGGAG
jgi:RimJ/RimL family protein N-acetyltransferase